MKIGKFIKFELTVQEIDNPKMLSLFMDDEVKNKKQTSNV